MNTGKRGKIRSPGNRPACRPANELRRRKELNMSDCIFCKIAEHEIPSDIVYEDDRICVYNDIAPQAPVHALMIPRKHIASLDDVTVEDQELLGYMLSKVSDIVKILGIENGYRVVSNNGDNAQQTVKHMHLHILGNRKFTWPPG